MLSCNNTYSYRMVHAQVASQLSPVLASVPTTTAFVTSMTSLLSESLDIQLMSSSFLGSMQSDSGSATTREALPIQSPQPVRNDVCCAYTLRVVNQKYGGCGLCRKGSSCKVGCMDVRSTVQFLRTLSSFACARAVHDVLLLLPLIACLAILFPLPLHIPRAVRCPCLTQP